MSKLLMQNSSSIHGDTDTCAARNPMVSFLNQKPPSTFKSQLLLVFFPFFDKMTKQNDQYQSIFRKQDYCRKNQTFVSAIPQNGYQKLKRYIQICTLPKKKSTV